MIASALRQAFWRARHEAWLRSELNQREYCEAQGNPLKAFGNWRAKFKAEPRPPEHKLLYRRGGLIHRLSHTLSHSLSHMTYEPTPIVRPAREGHRRRFSESDKRTIVEEASRSDASLSSVARANALASGWRKASAGSRRSAGCTRPDIEDETRSDGPSR